MSRWDVEVSREPFPVMMAHLESSGHLRSLQRSLLSEDGSLRQSWSSQISAESHLMMLIPASGEQKS